MIASLYPVLLTIHSGWRWLVLIGAVVALVAAARGLGGTRAFATGARKAAAAFTGIMDVQFLLGLVLYFVSPTVQGAMASMGAAMKTRELRFFLVEHTLLMLLAVAAAHVGSVKARRAADDARAHRTLLIWTLVTLVLILAGLPWFRPLFRLG